MKFEGIAVAMIKCNECGGDGISSKADTYPKERYSIEGQIIGLYATKLLALIASLSIAILVLSGCASRGYQRVCDWCDDASKAQLEKDVMECNAIAEDRFPDRQENRKTGRIVTSHGTTSCKTSKKGEVTCSTGSSYTYPEEERVDVTDYGARKKLFMECTDLRAQGYRRK